ncbi:fumarylacetoacetate hydrolase family protein [Pseudonocardia acaciae]|uniref:fumarylacetoacetate hydrolase family protein n=1 Tax=Pseudonocardia acaciae TaxID=551276 RepID=UPI0012ED76B8|nr:fumarylacetoacetate hydrolase family protein [Pseudonocardia acaciae]
MHLVRYADRQAGEVRVGLLGDDGELRAVPDVRRVADLLTLSRSAFDAALEQTDRRSVSVRGGDVVLLPPIDGRTELWAAGVTYHRSREARVEESTERSVYEKVYDADRPELFFKAPAWRVVTDREPIAVRDDSPLNVPEPELAAVANSAGELVGYLVANDVSSRSIEGENPLYLPQAKMYAGSAALSVGIRPAAELPDAAALPIEMTVTRNDRTVFEGRTSTAELRRPPAELLEHLYHAQRFPEGAVLCTGTGIVPALDVTLAAGDLVRITIDGVGELANPVVEGAAAMDWLIAAADNPLARPGAAT